MDIQWTKSKLLYLLHEKCIFILGFVAWTMVFRLLQVDGK